MQLNSCLEAAGIKLGTEIVDIIFSYSNKNYRVKTRDGDDLIVKIFSGDITGHISREREVQLLKIAAQYGITPGIVYVDPEYRFIISEWIEGIPYRVGAHHQTLLMKALSRLKKLESHIHLESQDNHSQLMRYEKRLRKSGKVQGHLLENVLEIGFKAIDHLESYGLEKGVCHMDLNMDNIIFTEERCYLIDFEYAQFNYMIFDWVSLIYLDKGPISIKMIETFFSMPEQDAIHWTQVYLLCLSWLWFQDVYAAREDESYLNQADVIYDQLIRLKKKGDV